MKIVEIYNVQPETCEIGMEIEMEGRNLPKFLPHTWRAIYYGPLRGAESVEYVLKTPCSRSAVKAVLKVLIGILNTNEARPILSDNCRVHIHINCQDMTVKKVINFISTYLVLESLLVNYRGEDQEDNLFSFQTPDAEDILPQLRRAIRHTDLKYMMDDNYRYAFLNVSTLAKFGSLEVRSLRTPKNLSEIADWVKILTEIKDASLTYKEPRNIVERASSMGPIQWLQSTLPTTAHLLDGPYSADLITQSVRNLRDIIYVSPRLKEASKGERK